MRTTLTLWGVLFMTLTINSQSICIEDLLVPNNKTMSQHDVAIYNGNKSRPDFVERRVIILEASRQKWVQEKIENCESEIPENCMRWVRRSTPEVVLDTLVVTDTIRQTDYETKTITFDKADGMHTERRPVLCASDFSRSAKDQLSEALEKHGFRAVTDQGILFAIREYQFDNKLPVGGVDAETLRHLGLDKIANKVAEGE